MNNKFNFYLSLMFTFALFITACQAHFGFNNKDSGGTLITNSVPDPLPTPNPDPNSPAPAPSPSPDPVPGPTPNPGPAPTPTPGPQDNGLYLCLLESAPGKSDRIGYVDNELVISHGAPKDVCMSANACLNIASQVFPVKGLFPDPCFGLLHNNAIDLSDEQIQALVDQMKH
jgi:hypothetical protein